MEKKNNNIQIEATELYGQCLGDKDTINGSSPERRPQGFVEIYEVDSDGTKKKVEGPNLVLYQGREWLAERLFNVDNPAVDTTGSQFISWLGLGDGGAPPGDPLNPISPANTNTELESDIPINPVDSDCADWRGSAYYKHPFDDVTFEQVTDNDSRYLICRVTTTIGIDDANGYTLSEAGLFVCDSNAGGATGPFRIFARITFPSIVKTTDRQLIFVWYCYV